MNITIPTKCELCPRTCGANRAEGVRGFCGASASLKLARAALHEWEEPPISARAGSGTVFFSNCPLRCVYCQNIDISQGGFGLEITTERLAEIFLELQAQDAANINLVTATQYLPWVLVPRGTYIYHYFASLPFLMSAIALCFTAKREKTQRILGIAAAAFTVAAVVFFIILFPYASGMSVSSSWLDIGSKILRIWY